MSLPPRFTDWPLSTVVRVNSVQLEKLRRQKQEPPDAVPTPWPTVNRLCMGAGGRIGPAHGHQVILAAASNKGKSTAAYNWAVRTMREGEHVLFVALEADLEEIAARLTAIASGTPIERITRGRQYDLEEDAEASRVLVDLPGDFFVNREPMYDLGDISAVVEAFHRQYECRTFFLDHLQLAQSGTDKAIYDRVTEISHVTRTLAVRHRLLSVALSQLNRSASRNRAECPTIHDLTGGSTLENDANLVLLIDHCTEHYTCDAMRREVRTDLIVGKNRHGPVGRVPVRHDLSTSRVEERMPHEEASYATG